jgi:hypothetical protein
MSPNTLFQRTQTAWRVADGQRPSRLNTTGERPMGRPPPALPFLHSSAGRCRRRVRAVELGPLGKNDLDILNNVYTF